MSTKTTRLKSLGYFYCQEREKVMDDNLKTFFSDTLINPNRYEELSNSYWLRHYGYSLQRWPISDMRVLNNKEKKKLFSNKSIYLLDYFISVGEEESNSLLFCCSLEDFSAQTLHVKARNQTKKAIENEDLLFKELDSKEKLNECYDVYLSAMRREHPSLTINRKSFTESILKKASLGCIRYYGIFFRDKLISFARVVLNLPDEGHIDLLKTDYNYRKYNPNNVLLFRICESLKHEIKYLYFGSESIEIKGGITHFKSRMGFHPVPVKRVLELHPLINLVPKFLIKIILNIGTVTGIVPKHRYEKACYLLKIMK